MPDATPTVGVLEPTPAARKESGRPAKRSPKWSVRWENRLVALVFFGLYAGIGAVLVLHYNSIAGDAMSRVANGSFVVRSADPHLAAVGFVWNPLPSILDIPLVLLSGLWPALLTHAFAGNILSAACMALSVAVMNGLLTEIGLRRAVRLTITVAFGLTPMIIYYGANGMSEAYLLLTQLIAARALLSWARDRNWRALVLAGVALGIGYFARYEALVSAAGAVIFITYVAYRSASGTTRERIRVAFTDVWLIGAPAGFAFVVWAGASWIIAGQPFAQFTSNYGNSNQVVQQGINTGSSTPFSWTHFRVTGTQILAIDPLLLLLCVMVLIIFWRRRGDSLLVPFAIFVPVLAFQAYAEVSGGTFGWWRFYIYTIPLTCVLLALLIQDWKLVQGPRFRRLHPRGRYRQVRGLLAAGAVLTLLAPFVTQAIAVRDNVIAPEETPQYDVVFHPNGAVAAQFRTRFVNERQIAAYLDAKHLPRQSVLVDVANGFAIAMASKHPTMFEITTDRQFKAALDGVGSNRVQYILDVPSGGRFAANAVNVKFPTMYENGAGIATLEREFVSTSDQPSWRLYRLKKHF